MTVKQSLVALALVLGGFLVGMCGCDHVATTNSHDRQVELREEAEPMATAHDLFMLRSDLVAKIQDTENYLFKGRREMNTLHDASIDNINERIDVLEKAINLMIRAELRR